MKRQKRLLVLTGVLAACVVIAFGISRIVMLCPWDKLKVTLPVSSNVKLLSSGAETPSTALPT